MLARLLSYLFYIVIGATGGALIAFAIAFIASATGNLHHVPSEVGGAILQAIGIGGVTAVVIDSIRWLLTKESLIW
jgi:hypothetical protein